MARGGRRTPSDQTPVVAGPGKFSRRTDGRQPIDVPNVGDSTELKQGDRQRLEESQRIAAVPRAASPRLQSPAPPGSPTSSGGGGTAQLPEYLFGGESTRPDEPITEGMPFGPGGGPEVLTPPPVDDVRQLALERYARVYDNPDAKRILTKLRAPVEAPTLPPEQLAPEPETFEPESQEVLDQDLATEEEVAVEGDEEELSVETPEAAASAEPSIGEDE